MIDTNLMPPLLLSDDDDLKDTWGAGKLRVALFFDSSIRHTTGHYVKRALERICSVSVYHHNMFSHVMGHYDLYLSIDDGSHYIFPATLRPSAIWLIDTHLTFSYDFVMAMSFDFVFCAQREGALKFHEKGFRNIHWLPLACDKEIHHDQGMNPAAKKYDVGFVGNLASGERREVLDRIINLYPDSYIHQADHTEMARIYGASRVVFNISICKDLNMRVFEGLCSGSPVLTDAVGSIESLFKDNEHLMLYRNREDAFNKIRYLLKNNAIAEQIAAQGYREAVRHHTYDHRARAILRRTLNVPLLHNQHRRIVAFIRRHRTLKLIMLMDFFNMWIMLPIIDSSLFADKLHRKITRAVTSALRRLRIVRNK